MTKIKVILEEPGKKILNKDILELLLYSEMHTKKDSLRIIEYQEIESEMSVSEILATYNKSELLVKFLEECLKVNTENPIYRLHLLKELAKELQKRDIEIIGKRKSIADLLEMNGVFTYVYNLLLNYCSYVDDGNAVESLKEINYLSNILVKEPVKDGKTFKEIAPEIIGTYLNNEMI